MGGSNTDEPCVSFLQTKCSTRESSFVVGVLCLQINLHEACRIEAGGAVTNPQSHYPNRCAGDVNAQSATGFIGSYRFLAGFYSIYRTCIYLHDRQCPMQSIRSTARVFIYRNFRIQN